MALRLPSGMKEYYGRNVDKMPEILKAGEIPMSAARFMQTRLLHGKEFPDLWDNYFDTSDLPVYPRSDKFGSDSVYTFLIVNNQGKIANDYSRQALELIVPDNLAGNHGVAVPDEMFEEWRDRGSEIGLIKIPRNKMTTDTRLTKYEVLNEQMWRVLARHPDEVPTGFAEDRNLLERYASEVESRTSNQKNMRIYVDASLKDRTTLKDWYVYGLGLGSYAVGGGGLDVGNGRFAFYSVGDATDDAEGVEVDRARVQLQTLERILKPEQIDQIEAALKERDELRTRSLTTRITTEQIYSAIQPYIGSVNESEVRKILDGLTKG